MRSKVAIIGWDSASFNIIRPMLNRGDLPNLSRLIQHGVSGDLETTIQPITPTAWTSFYTGVNPGRHGIFDFVHVDHDGTFRINNGSNVGFPSIWRRLSDAGRRVIVTNVPMTFPPEPVNGFLISGMDAPDQSRAFTHPPELAGDIEKKFGSYRVGVKMKAGRSPEENLDHYIAELIRLTEEHSQVLGDLIKRDDPDFLMTVFIAPDRIQHALGHLLKGEISLRDGIGRVYKACDDALGLIMSLLDETWHVAVVSDHGACAYDRVFELVTWLSRAGYLAMRTPTSLDVLREKSRLGERFIRRKLNLPIQSRSGLSQFENRINWKKTAAFAMGAFGNIYVNRIDRFPWGVLDANQAEALCDQLSEELLALRDDATGEPVVRQVYRSADIYEGPFSGMAPDLLIETYSNYFVRNNLDHEESRLFYEAGGYGNRPLEHTGRHTQHGLFILSGPDILSAGQSQHAQIVDIAPTVLYLSGLPIPTTLDGSFLKQWVRPEKIAKNPVVYFDDQGPQETLSDQHVYSSEEEQSVEDHLRDLGYID